MPTYQYACTACGEQTEAVQSFSDAPLTECAACGGKLRKVFSAVGVVFKGSGFYKTDSRASSGAKSESGDAGKKDAGKGDAPKTDSGSKTDAKPAAASTSSSTASSTGSTPAAKSA